MRQQVTFQPIQNQSIKFDTNTGTSRFAEIRDKQMTFQDEMFEIPVDNPKRASGGLMNHCKTHQLPYKLVCTTVGCSHELLCEKCEFQECNIADLDQFRQTVQSKGVLQEWHSSLVDNIQQLKQKINIEIEEWTTMAIAKVINDNTSILLNSSQTKSLLQQDVQYQKLVYNNFIDIASLNAFFSNSKTLQREERLFKDISDTFNTFTKSMQELLQYGQYTHSHALNKHLQQKQFEQISQTKCTSQIVALAQINSSTLATAQKNGAILILKSPSFQELCRFQHGIECTAIASVQDESCSNFLLSAGRDDIEYQIYLWNLDVRQKVGDVIGHSKQLRKIISLSNNLISWCQEDCIVRIWNLAEKQQVNEVAIHSSWINDICKITDTTIATCSRDYTVAVVDFNTAQPKYIIKDVTYVNEVCKLNSNTFAFANYHGHIKVYSSEAPILIRQMQAFDSWMGNNSIWSLVALSDSIVAAASEKEIAVVYLSENSTIKRLQYKNSEMLYLSQYKLFICTNDNEIKILK